MVMDRDALRDWHRLFGLLLTDFFRDSPFLIELERDLSQQKQLLDVVIVRRSRGRFAGRLPDGLDDLAEHNLITFKSRHEALDGWAMKELIGYYVAYRKLVSRSPSDLLPEDRFRLYAVAARFPHNLAGQLPWQERRAGVYDCSYGLDTVRAVVTGRLPRDAHNAPLHLFSASAELIDFGRGAYPRRSPETSRLLEQLFARLEAEGISMSFTMEDFNRQYVKERFAQLTPEERREALKALPPEKLREALEMLPPEQILAAFSAEQIRQYLDQLTAERPAAPRKPRRKK